jgi:hypothetical protein
MKTVKSTFSVSFFLKRNAQKINGNTPIIARITINGKVAQFSTKLEITPELWSVQSGKAIGRSNEIMQINCVLDGIRAKIQSHYQPLNIWKKFAEYSNIWLRQNSVKRQYGMLVSSTFHFPLVIGFHPLFNEIVSPSFDVKITLLSAYQS